jgi:hypothetical protein
LNGDHDNTGPSGAASIAGIATGAPGSGYAGDVAIEGYGALTVLNDVFSASAACNAGSVSITRIGAGGVSVRNISTHHSHAGTNCNYGAGDILISNVLGAVSIQGNLDAHSSCGSDTAGAGSLRIHASGDIRIDGSIDLGHPGASNRNGALSLTTTHRMSSITLHSLDLNKTGSATFSSGSKHSMIRNALLNFPVASPADGRLDAGAGQQIHYDIAVPGNSYLTNGFNGIFTLKSGGILTSEPPPRKGTIVRIY